MNNLEAGDFVAPQYDAEGGVINDPVAKNVKREEGFSQVCVWPGTTMGDTPIEEFVKFFKDSGFRIQYLEEIQTAPDREGVAGPPIEDTGGRTDQFFAIHEDDVPKFAVPRLNMGIRWIEDVVSKTNGYDKNPIYPSRVREYCSWAA